MSEQMSFADGKYTVINENGNLTALRNGEPWNRDLTGDNLIYWMLVEALELKRQRDLMLNAMQRIANPQNIHFAGDAQIVAREAIKAAAQ